MSSMPRDRCATRECLASKSWPAVTCAREPRVLPSNVPSGERETHTATTALAPACFTFILVAALATFFWVYPAAALSSLFGPDGRLSLLLWRATRWVSPSEQRTLKSRYWRRSHAGSLQQARLLEYSQPRRCRRTHPPGAAAAWLALSMALVETPFES